MRMLPKLVMLVGTAVGLVLMVATSAAAQSTADFDQVVRAISQPNHSFFRSGPAAV